MLHRYLLALVKAVPPARTGDERAVHQARVASRRLREALPVLAASGDDALRRARKRVRRVTRALGPVRELDVALAHLSEFESKGAAPSAAIEHVRRFITRQRNERRRAMLGVLTPGKLEKLKKPVTQAGVPAGARAAADVEASRRVIARSTKLAQAIERAGGMYLPDRLHAVRVAAKKLRYALELQQQIRRSRATSRIEQLKAMQDLLGRMHDLEVLIDRVRATEVEEAAVNRLVALDLDRLVRALEAECRELHATYMTKRGALLKLCEVVRATAESRLAAA
jgi:CHAD domain-containing protein